MPAVVLERVKAAAVGLVGLTVPGPPLALELPASGYPRRPASGADVVGFRIVRGPAITGARKFAVVSPTAVRWTIAAPVADSRVGLSIGGVRYLVDTGAAPTETSVRDLLLADITTIPELLPGVTVSSAGADSIDFAADGGAPGLLRCAIALGPGATRTIVSDTTAEVETANARVMLQFTAFAAGAGTTAQSLLGDLAAGLHGNATIALRDRLGVAFEGPAGDIVDLVGKAGPTWESRAALRVPVHLRSYRATAIDYIDTATMADMALRLPTGEDVGPDEFTVTA